MKSKALDVDGDPSVISCIYVGLYSNICDGQQVPVLRADRIMNPDAVADPVIVHDTTIGPTYPTKLIGLGTTISLGKSLQIDALIEHQGGHFLPDYTAYQNERRGSWHPCFAMQGIMVDAYKSGGAAAVSAALNAAGVTAQERARCAIKSSVNAGYGYEADYWIESADFWRMRSVTVSYDVPKSFLNWGRSATVTLAARNLFTITNYKGTDPEVQDFADAQGNVVSGGRFGRRDYYQIPNPRTFLLSIRLSW
jgi:hypothetical protein